jgi:hypothetical protein
VSQESAESRSVVLPSFFAATNPKLLVLFSLQAVRTLAEYTMVPFLALYFHLALGFSLAQSGMLLGLGFEQFH